jgi:hypothetical protein
LNAVGRLPAGLDDDHLRAARVARRRDEAEPGQQLVFSVDTHVLHAGRVDPLADRVVVAECVVELEALELTTTSMPSRSKSCSLSGRRRGSMSASSGCSSVTPVSTRTRASGWSMTCT